MHIQVDRSRSLRIDGVDLGMVTATKITRGAASIETVKPEGTHPSRRRRSTDGSCAQWR